MKVMIKITLKQYNVLVLTVHFLVYLENKEFTILKMLKLITKKSV